MSNIIGELTHKISTSLSHYYIRLALSHFCCPLARNSDCVDGGSLLAALVTVLLDVTDTYWFKQKGAESGNHCPHWLLHAIYLSSLDPKSLHVWDKPNTSCLSTKNWIINVISVLWILMKGFSALALLVLRAREFFVERRGWSPCGMCSNNTG